MAMLPFCGYNIGNYLGHWLEMGTKMARPPRIFMVNWFRKDSAGKFLWPGYGENLRVLKWMLDRIEGKVGGNKTAVGIVPRPEDIDLTGLEISPSQLSQALAIDVGEWRTETKSAGELFDRIGRALPATLKERQQELRTRLDGDGADRSKAV
jgi:phosphoenolpyruvate carboxykinase (GTP)